VVILPLTHICQKLSEIIEPIALESNGAEVQSSEEALSEIDRLNNIILNKGCINDMNVLCEFTSDALHNNNNTALRVLEHSNNMADRMEHEQQITNSHFTHFSDSDNDKMYGNATIYSDNDGKTNEDLIGKQFNDTYVEGAEQLSCSVLNDSDESTIRTLTELATNRVIEVDGDHKDNTVGEGQKHSNLITDYFSEINGPTQPDQKKGNKILEQSARNDFASDKGILNCRLGRGLAAGGLWRDNIGDDTEIRPPPSKDRASTLQDMNARPVLMGCDVVGLYPNLDQVSVSQITMEAVRSTKVKFSGINYALLAIYLVLVMGPIQMAKVGLHECIPKKKINSNSQSLSNNINIDITNWDLEHIVYSEENKKEMIARMVQIMVLLLSSTTCYKFGGSIYKQKKGLGIGLRASAAIARLTMCTWDSTWEKCWTYSVLIFQVR